MRIHPPDVALLVATLHDSAPIPRDVLEGFRQMAEDAASYLFDKAGADEWERFYREFSAAISRM